MEYLHKEQGWHLRLTGFLIVVSGPSGAGKNSLINAVIPAIPDLHYSVSVTTRPPRDGEVEGIDYFFRSEEQFSSLIDDEQLLEWAEFCGYRYGTPKSFVEEAVQGGHTVILDVDIQGAKQIRALMPEAVFVFLLPPTRDELKRRLTGRGKDSAAVIEQRLQQSGEELRHIGDYDYYLINDQLDKASQRLRSIINAEWCRVQRIDPQELAEVWKGRKND